MLPAAVGGLSPASVVYRAAEAFEETQAKETDVIIPPEAPSVPRPPSLESLMLEHKVSEQLKPFSTKVTKEDFQTFKAFWLRWVDQPAPEWEHAAILKTVLQGNPSTTAMIEAVFEAYQTLFPVYSRGRLHLMNANLRVIRQKYIQNIYTLSGVFVQCCERDSLTKARQQILLYRPYYAKEIHPYFLILQRFVNFLHEMLEREQAVELKRPFGDISVGDVGGLGFYRDATGYVPIAFYKNPQDLEVIYFHMGEDLEKVFLFDNGEFISQSGFLIDIVNGSEGPLAKVRGFYGAGTPNPFCATEISHLMPLDIEEPKFQTLFALIDDEIQLFLKMREQRRIFFIPIPAQGYESTEFYYCLLQDLILRSRISAVPEQQEQAIQFLKAIEKCEGKSVETLVNELEREIKDNLRSEYEREVEEEQLKRSKQVSEGTTPGMKVERKPHKGKKREKVKPVQEAPKSLDQRVEEGFKEFQIKGRIKYRHLMKVTRKVMKKFPETLEALQDVRQHGSHQVMHTEEAPETLVRPHGRKDAAVSQRSANRFLSALMDQVKKVFSS